MAMKGIANYWIFRKLSLHRWTMPRRWLQAWRIVSYIIKSVGEHQAAPDGALGKRFRREF
jgi:hypothetical protein